MRAHTLLCSARSVAVVVVGAALGVGCKREAPAPVEDRPAAPAAVSASASTSAPGSASQASPPVATPRGAPLLFLVAKGHHGIGVAKLEGGTFVYDEQLGVFARAKGDDLVVDASMQADLPLNTSYPRLHSAIMSMSGRFPESAWLTLQSWVGLGAWRNGLYRWKGAWVALPESTSTALPYYEKVTPWSEGRFLTLVASSGYRTVGGCTLEFLVVEGPKPSVLPEDNAGPPPSEMPPEFGGCSRIVPGVGGLRALPSGDVFLLGTEATSSGAGVVERWKPGEAKGVLDRLPGRTQVVPAAILVRGANDVLVGGRVASGTGWAPYLARFDGTAWSKEEAPGAHTVVDIAESADGSVWIAEAPVDGVRAAGISSRPEERGGGVYYRPPGGAWQKVPFPEGTPPGTSPSRIVADGGDVYVAAKGPNLESRDTTSPGRLFRTRPATTLLDFESAAPSPPASASGAPRP